jgi:hypothetical protein
VPTVSLQAGKILILVVKSLNGSTVPLKAGEKKDDGIGNMHLPGVEPLLLTAIMISSENIVTARVPYTTVLFPLYSTPYVAERFENTVRIKTQAKIKKELDQNFKCTGRESNPSSPLR